jgi:hypothetical protein
VPQLGSIFEGAAAIRGCLEDWFAAFTEFEIEFEEVLDRGVVYLSMAGASSVADVAASYFAGAHVRERADALRAPAPHPLERRRLATVRAARPTAAKHCRNEPLSIGLGSGRDRVYVCLDLWIAVMVCHRGIEILPAAADVTSRVPGATPGEARRRRDPGPVSGGLRNARDALLIEPHLACDLVVRDTFGLAQIVDDEAGLNGIALKLLVLADGSDLLGRAV